MIQIGFCRHARMDAIIWKFCFGGGSFLGTLEAGLLIASLCLEALRARLWLAYSFAGIAGIAQYGKF